MLSRTLLASVLSLTPLLAQTRTFSQPAPAHDVTIAAIPGVVDAGAKWTKVWEGTATADGMVGTEDGGILSAQEQTDQINKIDKDGKFSVYSKAPHGPGAISIGPKNRILIVERTCTDPGGHLGTKPEDCKEATDVAALTPERKILANNIDGKSLGRVNDLVADKKGGAYITSGQVFYMNPKGKVSVVADNIRPNGIILSADEKTLYVTNGNTIVAFDVQPDGSVKNQRDFGKLEAGGAGDGMAIDSTGRLYVTSNMGVQVLSPEGKYLGIIPTPRAAITLAFSGPAKKTLYVGTMGAIIDGNEFATAPGVRNIAMTIYSIPMQSEGFKGRSK
ncbi:MAG: SMP-30/gluconolactonase/LRE family protein [Bryobacterales bacterium]|nr:SMP-30/gluconolactonase/LRE family protein [Bryobacterales bacterium]MBV9400536.1 SMP-30/gluconolactonase/LRE family protein [Bryobacterales bacterium]